MIGEESSVLNPANLKQLIKQHVGSLRFKESNNENENLLVYLLKCKQLTDDKPSIHNFKELNSNQNNLSNGEEENLNCDRAKNRNDKKPLIECQKNSMNNKHSKTPKINLRPISPLLKTDHRYHTPLQSSQANFDSLNNANALNQTVQLSTSNNHHSGGSVFQRRNRISSTLPKSLNSTTNKPVCVNLFNQTNLNSFDTSDLSTSDQQTTFNNTTNRLNNTQNSPNPTNDPNNNSTTIMGNNNKRGKLSSFLRSIINRNSSSENSQYDKRSSALKRNEKSNVLINLRRNKKILVKNTVFGCEVSSFDLRKILFN